MNSQTEPRFWRMYHDLPEAVRKAARRKFELFQSDPDHPGLHFKPLKRHPGFGSVRITRGYRAVGLVEGDTITWSWIGSHADFDRDFG